MAATLTVNAPDAQYQIVIESGLLQQRDLSERFSLNGRLVVVSNPMIASLHAQQFVDELPDAQLVLMLDGERYKTLNTVEMLYGDFVAAGADRLSTIVAFGGGVVGDVAGFAAASYMRGVRLVQVPTTLLAMVDSSVGGKVGVDLPQGKNMVGAFKQPEVVLIDPDVLHTLPVHEWRCGMAEVIKHGLLADEYLLEPELHRPERAAELIERAVQVKIDVVQADPYEHGIRAHLNLGHTFAHAIERVTQYAWSHGDAVAVGLLAALRLSVILDLCDESLYGRLDTILAEIGLPRRIGDLQPESLLAAMHTDKKWRNGCSRFVLLEGVGKPCIVEGIASDKVIAALDSLR